MAETAYGRVLGGLGDGTSQAFNRFCRGGMNDEEKCREHSMGYRPHEAPLSVTRKRLA